MSTEFDLICDELKNKLVEDINNAKLPITVTCYILKEILETANDKKLQVVAAEQQARLQNRTQDELIKQEVENGDTE